MCVFDYVCVVTITTHTTYHCAFNIVALHVFAPLMPFVVSLNKAAQLEFGILRFCIFTFLRLNTALRVCVSALLYSTYCSGYRFALMLVLWFRHCFWLCSRFCSACVTSEFQLRLSLVPDDYTLLIITLAPAIYCVFLEFTDYDVLSKL